MGKPKCCLEMSSYWLTFPIMSDDSTRMLKMVTDPIFLIIIAPSGYKNGYNSTFSVHFLKKPPNPTLLFSQPTNQRLNRERDAVMVLKWIRFRAVL